jgi:hypothetical protein
MVVLFVVQKGRAVLFDFANATEIVGYVGHILGEEIR